MHNDLNIDCSLCFLFSDDASAPEQPLMASQTMLTDETLSAVSKCSKTAVKTSDIETANLSPSLIPAQQPTISLITDDNTDTLSVESLTLVPPVDPHSIRTFSCIPQASLQPELEADMVKEVEGECSD